MICVCISSNFLGYIYIRQFYCMYIIYIYIYVYIYIYSRELLCKKMFEGLKVCEIVLIYMFCSLEYAIIGLM